MLIKAHAKINWYLRVAGKREDGYHLLDMLMQQISLHDDIQLLPSEDLTLQVLNASPVPDTTDNLAYRAAKALQDYAGTSSGAVITLKKRIPVGAGLGGGSADAAAVLHGLNKLWALNLSLRTLSEIGLSLGADIPYCLTGGFARVQGIGEMVEPLHALRQHWLVVIQPCKGLSTKEVFGSLDISPAKADDTSGIMKVQDAIDRGDYHTLNQFSRNDLQQTSALLRPAIQDAVRLLMSTGAKYAMMSGSGSAVFGVFGTYQLANTAYKSINKKYRSCYLTYTLKDNPYQEFIVKN